MKYDFTAIEAKWHKIWDEKQLYAARTGSDAKKFYALVQSRTVEGATFIRSAKPFSFISSFFISALTMSGP